MEATARENTDDSEPSSGRQTPADLLVDTKEPPEVCTPSGDAVIIEGSFENGTPTTKPSSSSKKRKTDGTVDNETQVLALLQQSSDAIVKRRERPPRDANLTWAESIGLRMQTMAPRQRAVIRARVEQVMLEVEFGTEPAQCSGMAHNSYTTLSSVAGVLGESSAMLSAFDRFSS